MESLTVGLRFVEVAAILRRQEKAERTVNRH